MFNRYTITKGLIPFIIPYIILYAIYIQINGEVSPGGGFQAGVIFASAIVACDLIFSKEKIEKYFPINSLVVCAVSGVLLYLSIGLISFIFNDNFLDYSSLAKNKINGQHIGIFCIEIGVGLTVSSVISLIYFLLRD